MKLVQLNIWQGRLLDQVVVLLQAEQPDIICLQEVYSSKLTTPLLPFFSSLERLKATFPNYQAYFSPVSSTAVLGEAVSYGNAILSRPPLKDVTTFDIHEHFKNVTVQAEMSNNTRNLQRVTVMLDNGQELCLMNHHGYWEPNSVGSDITLAKMQDVADIVKRSKRPLILSGDLQIAPQSPAMQPLQALLRDLTQEYGLKTTLNTFGKAKDVPCDHICVSEGITVKSFSVKDALVSDHKALVLEFTA